MKMNTIRKDLNKNNSRWCKKFHKKFLNSRVAVADQKDQGASTPRQAGTH